MDSVQPVDYLVLLVASIYLHVHSHTVTRRDAKEISKTALSSQAAASCHCSTQLCSTQHNWTKYQINGTAVPSAIVTRWSIVYILTCPVLLRDMLRLRGYAYGNMCGFFESLLIYILAVRCDIRRGEPGTRLIMRSAHRNRLEPATGILNTRTRRCIH